MPFNFRITIRSAALLALAGFILSAPVAVAIVSLSTPQPTWESAEVFRNHFHWLQTLPYFFGFLLVIGLVLLVFAHKMEYRNQSKDLDHALQLASGTIFLFAGLVIVNYICQTTFVPHLVLDSEKHDALISAFSMTNPRSLAWSLEMWGYAIMAIALWLLSGCYKNNKIIPALLTLNLILSIASLAWSIIDPIWVETRLGFILFMAWNALMILLVLLIFLHARPNARTGRLKVSNSSEYK